MIVSKKKFVSEIVKKTLGNKINFCKLAGPSFADEIIKQNPTMVVVAADNLDVICFFIFFSIINFYK